MSLKAEIEEIHERMTIIANEVKKLRGQQSVAFKELLNCDPKFSESKMIGGNIVMGSCESDLTKRWEGWALSLHNLGEQINEKLGQLRNYSEHYDGLVIAYKEEFPKEAVLAAEKGTGDFSDPVGAMVAKLVTKIQDENYGNFLSETGKNCLIRDIGLPLIVVGLIFLAIKK